MSKSKQRTVVVMFFFRKAFERLGFRVASEFLYTEYKVMLVFKVQGVQCTSWPSCRWKRSVSLRRSRTIGGRRS